MSKSKARFLGELLSSDGKVVKSKSEASTIVVGDLPTIPNSKLQNSSVTIAGEGLSLGASLTLDTGDVTEHTNYKYYTDGRVDARITNAGSGNWNTAYTYSQVGHLPLTGGTLTGNLVATTANFTGNVALGNSGTSNSLIVGGNFGKKYWTRGYAVSTSNIGELVNEDGTSLATGGAYRFTGHIDGTGTDQSSRAVFWNENGTWNVNVTGQSGTSSNHIQFLVSGGVPSVKTYHANNYTVRVWHERINLNENAGTDNSEHYFGADAYLSKIGDALTLNSPTTVSGTVTATGGNSTNWNTAYGWGNHASAGYVTSSGNTIIGTDTDLSFAGANVLASIALTDGVITSYANRVLTLANLGYTGETNATADQSAAEIRAAVEAASDSNVFTDADHTKLGGIAASANNYVLPSGIATESYVNSEITTLIGGAPSTLNDLNELAAAINDDANYNSTLTTALATKLPLAGGTLTGALGGTNINILADAANSANDASLYIRKTNNNDWGIKLHGTGSATEYGIQVDLNGTHSFAFRGMNNGGQYFRVGTDMLLHTAEIRGNSFSVNGATVITTGKDLVIGTQINFNNATNSSFIGAASTSNLRYAADGIHYFDTYNGGWGTRAQIGDNYLNLGANVAFQMNGTTVIDASRNLSNIGTGAFSGKVTITNSGYNNHLRFVRSGQGDLYLSPSANQLLLGGGGFSPDVSNNRDLGRTDKYWQDLWLGTSLKMGGQTAIDANRNLTNIGTISSGAITANGGAVYSETTQGAAKGTIHLDPDSATDHAGTALTFGASDSGNGNSAHAGIYTRSDGSYGTKMYLSTTNDYGAGSKTAIKIDSLGHVGIMRGDLKIGTTTVIDASRNLTNIGTISSGTINSGAITVPSVYLNSGTNTRLHQGQAYALRIQTPTGYIDIGSMNSGFIHFQGNKPYYFNQAMIIDNHLYPYSTAGSRNLGTTSNVWNHVYAKGYFIDSTQVIDTSRNITMGSTLTVAADGATNYTSNHIRFMSHNTARGAGHFMMDDAGANTWYTGTAYADAFNNWGVHYKAANEDEETAHTQRRVFSVSKVGNAVFAGTIASGAITSSGLLNLGGTGSLGSITTNQKILANFNGGYSTNNSAQNKVIGFIGTTVSSLDIFNSSYGSSGELAKNFYLGLSAPNSYFNNAKFVIVQGGVERFNMAQGGNSTFSGAITVGGIVTNAAVNTFQDSAGAVINFKKGATSHAVITNRSYGFHNGNGLSIATMDAQPIRFAINDVEKLQLTSAGDLNVKGAQIAFTASSNGDKKLNFSGHGGASGYNYFLGAANDGGNKAVMFVNGSSRTADGGINTFTIRNDAGPINVGRSTQTTKLLGSGSLLFNGNTVWHAGNDGAGSGLDADLLDGKDSILFTRYRSVFGSGSNKNWNTEIADVGGAGRMHWDEVQNISTSWTNGPIATFSSAYTYGGVQSVYLGSQKYQMYVPHLASNGNGVYYRSGWGASQWYDWRVFLDSGNIASYAWTSSNDGSGSGLDADLLDGQQATAFATAAQGTLASNALPKSGGTMTGAINTNGSNIVVNSGTGLYTTGTETKFTTAHGYIALGPMNTSHAHIYTDRSNFYFNVNTLYQNGNLIWGANNDGAGSGLDADLLDGQQGSYYYAASNPSGYITASGNAATSHAVTGSAFATTSSPGSVLEYQQASGQTDTKLAPSGDWHNSIRLGHGNPYSYYSSILAVRMTGTGPGDLYTQTIQSGTGQGWGKHWSTRNDGSGSGLDADLLDGQHASAFATLSGSNSFTNSYNEFGNGTGSVSNDGTWNARVNIAGSSHARLDVKSVSDGIITSMFSHTGHAAGKVGTYSNHPLHLMTNGTGRAVLSTSGSLSTTPQGTLWGAGNDGSGSGLDADLLDGQQGAYYYSKTNMDAARNIVSGTDLDTDLANGGAFSSYGSGGTSWNAPFSYGGVLGWGFTSGIQGQIGFDIRHNQSAYSDFWFRGKNNLGFNPWSKVWHTLNDGSGSGLDADLLDGLQLHTGRNDVANRVVRTQANGYIDAGWINTTSGTASGAVTRIYCSQDGYIRYLAPAAFMTNIGALAKAGGTMTGTLNVSATTNLRDTKISGGYHLQRSDHHSGHLEGSYNNIGANGAKSNPIYTIGSSYNPSDAALSNMYGIGFSDEGSTPSFFPGSFIGGWGMYVAADGDARVFLDGSSGHGTFTGQVRATGFYDVDDTAYYSDPASTGTALKVQGAISVLSSHSGGNIELDYPYGGNTTYAGNMLMFMSEPGITHDGGGIGNNIDIRSPYYGRKYNHGYGVYLRFYKTSGHFEFWNTQGNAGSSSGQGTRRFWGDATGNTYSQTSFRAPVFYDSNDTNYYTNPADNTHLNTLSTTGAITVGTGASSDIYMSDSDEGARRIHCNSNRIGFLNSSSNWGAYCADNGDWTTDFISYAGASSRAPIFYDSNDTAYFINPNSDNRLSQLRLASHLSVGGFTDAGPSNVGTSASITFGSLSADAVANYCIKTTLENYGGNYNKLDLAFHTGIRLGAHPNYGGVRFYTDQTMATEILAVGKSGNFVQAAYSMRAPLFYDSQNTAYYFDGASSSTSLRINGDVLCDGQYGKGMVGLYSSTVLQHVWAMGGAYRLAADGSTTGSMYGMAWSHPNAGTKGGANHLNDHGLLIINNGGFRAAISSRAVFSADVRGTLFYDYNSTAYYCDPSSTSNLNTVQVGGVLHANGGITLDGTNVFNGSDTWFRPTGASGMYFPSYGGGVYSTDSTYVRIYNGKAFQVDSASGIRSSGNITAYYSDERLKTKTGKIENALEKVQSLSGFTYVENELARSLGYENENEQVALSAQDVQKVMPQAVSLAPCDMEVGEFDGVVTSKSGENYLTVDYARLIPLLVESIKELTDKVEMLEKQLK